MAQDKYEKLAAAIWAGNIENGINEAKKLAEDDVAPAAIFAECIEPQLTLVGDAFSKMDIFLPEMILAANVVKGVQEGLLGYMSQETYEKKGRILLATVYGDLHDIGKNIVKSMLEVNGFEVRDLGVDVPTANIIKEAKDFEADIIALSALMLPSLPYMEDVIELARNAENAPYNFRIMVGGGPISRDWADSVNVAYGDDAADAVRVANRLMESKEPDGSGLKIKKRTGPKVPESLALGGNARLLDLVDRAVSGPIIEEETFDRVQVSQGLKRVLSEYGIQVNSENIINQDDGLADRVWQAAMDFVVECGVYHKDTGRLIQYSQAEIEQLLGAAQSEVTLGLGHDAVVERARKVEDPSRLIVDGCSIGSPIPEKFFVPAMVSYIKEPIVDVTCGHSLETVHGRESRTRTPLEIMAAWREMDLALEALEKAGRPGMAYTGCMMSMSDIGQLSATQAGGLRPTDLNTFGIISELKANWEIFNKVAHMVRTGGVIDAYANAIYGGMGGGADGHAVLICAEMIALSVVFQAQCVGASPTHPFLFCSTERNMMAAASVAYQAIARNSHLMTNLSITAVGGPCTNTLLYETIAYSLMATLSGNSRLLGPRPATGVVSGHFTGLEARFMGEICHAAVKLNRGEAEEIAQKAFAKCEEDMKHKPYGKPFWEAYDTDSIRPRDEWRKMYEEVKNEAATWGLALN